MRQQSVQASLITGIVAKQFAFIVNETSIAVAGQTTFLFAVHACFSSL